MPDPKNGVVECETCEGKGTLKVDITCHKCGGDGHLDWIENVVGKEDKIEFTHTNNFNAAMEITYGGDLKIGNMYVADTIESLEERVEELESIVEQLLQRLGE